MTDDLPAGLRPQAGAVADCLRRTLGESLIGVWVHGSVCLGEYIPGVSDLDILAVCGRPMPAEERAEFARTLLTLHGRPAPIEMSVVQYAHLVPWRHPTPCQFHFSSTWADRYADYLARRDYSSPLLSENFTDGDIACHAALTRERGICLGGRPAREVLPEVPAADFWDSIAGDLDNFRLTDYGPLYLSSNILTLCRVWSYAVLGRILTKAQAGRWAAGLLPAPICGPVLAAVRARTEQGPPPDGDPAALEALRAELLRRIRADAPFPR